MDTGLDEAVEESPLRFDHDRHEYLDVRTGEVLPNITSMLVKTGHVDDRWFTEASRRRGSEVHRLSLDLDLDAITLDDIPLRHPQRRWVEAYAAMRESLPHSWSHLEEPFIHPVLRFGGTPDRAGRIYKVKGLLEIKTGPYSKSHLLQTALQAILLSRTFHLPPEQIGRFCVYLQENGRFKVEQFEDAVDIRRARKVLRECCEV